jgi:hypothetical protein
MSGGWRYERREDYRQETRAPRQADNAAQHALPRISFEYRTVLPCRARTRTTILW